MPVMSCSTDGKSGYKWGDSGKCYTYPADNETARKRAKRKAHLQGSAIQHNSGKEMTVSSNTITVGNPIGVTSTVQEYDDSINDYVEQVRHEFSMQFPAVYNSEEDYSYCYVVDVFADYVIVKDDEQYYKVSYEESEDSIT